MKIRNGFVSNSSSSSFIINGVKISVEHKIFTEEFLESISNHSELEFYETDLFYYFGENLVDIDEYGMTEDKEIEIFDILEKIQKYFPDTTKEDIKIFCGSFVC